MDDFEDLPVETQAGERPAGAVGDRLLIGLAALALLGGLLIAAANFLSGFLPGSAVEPSATPDPSPTVVASRVPPATPTERTLQEVTVIPGAPPEVEDPGLSQIGKTYWIEALEALPIRPSIDAEEEEVGQIAAGDVAVAEQQPWMAPTESGWLYVYGADLAGWVNTLDAAGRPLANVYEADRPMFSSMVQAVAAGSTGFVAHGSAPSRGWAPGAPITLFSADGVTWSRTEVGSQPWGAWAAAWGPSGWLAAHTATNQDGVESTWLWESASGFSWSPIGELDLPGHGFLMQLVGSDSRGYLLVEASGVAAGASLWFSPDGLIWQESAGPPDLGERGAFYEAEALRVTASEAGFLAWRTGEQVASGTVGAFTDDGRSWTPIELAPGSGASWLVLGPAGDSVVGLGRDNEGVTRAYRGTLDAAADALLLERVRHLDLVFDGAIVRNLVSDGTTAYAFGNAREGSDLAWSGDATGWRRLQTPDGGFGQPVQLAAAGSDGLLVVGADPSVPPMDPVLWHLSRGGRWAREATEAFPPTPAPTPEECGAPPDSALEFAGLHPSLAVPCFADRELTFTAWSMDCTDCFGRGSGSGSPGWLMDPAHSFALLPIEMRADSGGWWREAIPAADVPWRDEYVGAWLRITGHYDDPASSRCRWTPAEADEIYYFGVQADVNACRLRFVVTEVAVVDGPRS